MTWIVLAWVFGALLLLIVIFVTICVVLYLCADFGEPKGVSIDTSTKSDQAHLYKNRHGLWEAHVKGDALERGAAYGSLCRDLLEQQEEAFFNRIHEIIPSKRWVNFLHKVVILFNRNMARHIPDEYRNEIYAISHSASDKYNNYGSKYVRQLNYHAAHDIGHAMQKYMLVGCTSFAAWGKSSASGELIVARNFDFYVGEEFAKNKMVLFVEPTGGYRFVSLSWPGMIGVVSGMNEHGLTITLNAIEGAIPLKSAMPISLLARHIMQHATTIDEAYAIAKQFKSFVSEAMLVASAKDGCAAIIEKTPKRIGIYRTEQNHILCANHAQSAELRHDKHNIKNMATTDSLYRFERLEELVAQHAPIDVARAADIMRDTRGKGDNDIGLGNEKVMNQLIAFHSVVFEPTKLRLWVSTSPWQFGEYVCYDLGKVFDGSLPRSGSYALEELNIAADKVAIESIYPRILRYRELHTTISKNINTKRTIDASILGEFEAVNPNFYDTYNILGDYYLAVVRDRVRAVEYWRKALGLEIPKQSEREKIIRKIDKYKV